MTIFELRKITKVINGEKVNTDLYQRYEDAVEEMEKRINYQTTMRDDTVVRRWNDKVNINIVDSYDGTEFSYITYQIFEKKVN